MLTLDQFPENHVGVCIMCKRGTDTASPPPQLQSLPLHARRDSVSEHEQSGQEQLPRHISQSVQRRSTPYSALASGRPSSFHRQQNPHSVLPGSVTTYSDAGQYPSGRSTYGVTKISQRGRRGRTKTSTLPNQTFNNLHSQVPCERATTGKLQELNELFRSLSQTEYNNFIRSLSRDVQEVEPPQNQLLQEVALNETSRSTSETQDEDSTADVTLYPVTSAVTKCIDEICKLWNVPDIAYIFPKAIWPNPKTPWPIGVLKEFRDMAQKYPNTDCRQSISSKFAELVQARRRRSNAKSQWSIVDARTTHAWAKEQYGLESASDADEDDEDDREHSNTIVLRSSQPPRPQVPLARTFPLQSKALSKRQYTIRTYSRKHSN